MKQSTKLLLDIVMGAIVPILILNNLTRPLGAPLAYLCAALVPVGWVFIDLLFITRRFNFITSYVGFTAIVNGALAFWFVDGLLFAVKDTAAFLVMILVFGGSLVATRPMLQYFFAQVVNPDSVERQAALTNLLAVPSVRRATMLGTGLVVIQNVAAGTLNFYLNLTMVIAPFGTEEFNQQVAQVNGITRLALPLPAMLVFGVGLWLVYRAVFRLLPSEPGKSQIESDFWELMRRRQQPDSDGARG